MLVGSVDIRERERITGWAADTDQPTSTIEVVCHIDGREVARVSADVLRRDLQRTGRYGDGRHGFVFTFREPIPNTEDHEVTIRFTSNGELLERGRFKFIRPAAGHVMPEAPRRQMGGLPRYVIHIGMPKTGSKYLQQSFCTLQDTMLKDGIYYPSKYWPSLPIFGHHELTHQIEVAPNPALERIFDELNRSGARTILLSCEGMIGNSRTALEHLRRLTGGAEVSIAFFARRWSDWIPSHWQQSIKQGSIATFPETVSETLASASTISAVNYNMILDIFSDIFGSDNIYIIPYTTLLDRGADIFLHFARYLLGWHYDMERHETVHSSMGAQLTEVIRCLNVLETDRTGSSSYRIYEAYDVRQMSRVVQDDLERVFAAMARSTSSILPDR